MSRKTREITVKETEKSERKSDINLTVYINIVSESEASAEQQKAIAEMREIFAEMVEQ